MTEVLEAVNRKVLPKKKKQQEKSWVSTKSEDLIASLGAHRKIYRNHRNEENYRRWRKSAEATEKALQQDKLKSIEEACNEAAEAAKKNHLSEVYNIIRRVSGQNKANTAETVNKRDGRPPSDRNELLKEWVSYFSDLLNSGRRGQNIAPNIPPAECDLDVSLTDFTIEELKRAIRTSKLNKAPGTDKYVSAETLRYG